ncbi:MAG: short chain dehydrogenase [Gemmatimonadota bacterium]
MKVLLVGATGTIGSAVDALLVRHDHEVVRVGHSRGDVQVDLADKASIEAMYMKVGGVDAVVSTAGIARFGPLQELSDEDFEFSLHHKLMGQVNLVRLGLPFVAEGGSFTLTSGTLSQDPTPGTVAVAMVGGALESFVKAAALDLSPAHRINIVSPGWVRETMEAMGMDPSPGTPAADVAKAYLDVLHGEGTGETVLV